MNCTQCGLDSGPEWLTLCPTSQGGCGYTYNFFEWLRYSHPVLGAILLAGVAFCVLGFLLIGFWALQDYTYLNKRSQYCDRMEISSSLLTDEAKTRQFYACTF